MQDLKELNKIRLGRLKFNSPKTKFPILNLRVFNLVYFLIAICYTLQ